MPAAICSFEPDDLKVCIYTGLRDPWSLIGYPGVLEGTDKLAHIVIESYRGQPKLSHSGQQ